jgi:hydroxymethylglutaryl-CoA reductase (NADPH)
VLAGYVAMHTTFVRLFLASRALGSNFWLPVAILSSAVLALLAALPLCGALRIPLDPICLSEALPFIVCTVGFDKPLRLARAVFAHPDAVRTPASGAATPLAGGTRRAGVKPAAAVVLDALDGAGPGILRDYALEVAVLAAGAYSRVGGLRDLCAFAAVLLALDGVVSMTFYVAVLAVVVDVRRINTLRTMSARKIAHPTRAGNASGVDEDGPASLTQRVSAAVLGAKGGALEGLAREGGLARAEDPVPRLKLLLVSVAQRRSAVCADRAPADRVVPDSAHPQPDGDANARGGSCPL